MDGEIRLFVDDEKIDPNLVKKYLILNPFFYDYNYYLAPSLPLFSETDTNYYNDAHFERELGKERLEILNNLNDIEELNKVVDYFKNSLKFGIWINEQLFQYNTTRNLDILRKQYPGLKDNEEVRNAITSLENANSNYEKWEISTYIWHSAYNHIYREQEEAFPKDVWDMFLEKYDIVQEIEVWAE